MDFQYYMNSIYEFSVLWTLSIMNTVLCIPSTIILWCAYFYMCHANDNCLYCAWKKFLSRPINISYLILSYLTPQSITPPPENRWGNYRLFVSILLAIVVNIYQLCTVWKPNISTFLCYQISSDRLSPIFTWYDSQTSSKTASTSCHHF